MKIILFQGNFPPEYQKTRHNIGFELADFLAQKNSVSFRKQEKFKAEIAEIVRNGEKTLLIKPLTFYNETGRTARAICDFYKVDWRQDLLVFHDDLDLEFGVIRARKKGSSAGNNGLKSIIANLDDEFARVKIGIKNELLARMNSADFVLSKFSQNEAKNLPQIFEKCEEFFEDFENGTFENHKISL
ncbi:MAG: aminoacyl-tRNA hydrolase [bacterium]|nr:aminoacyl-tRNA hydrolase [bacterium]